MSTQTAGTAPGDARLPAPPGDSSRVCGSCRKTRLSGYNPGEWQGIYDIRQLL